MPVRYSNNGGRPEGAPPAGYQQRLQFYDREETELLVKLKRTDKKECGEVIWETTIERKRSGEETPTRIKMMHISRIQPNKLRLWMETVVGELVGEDERLGVESGFLFVVRTPSGLERLESWPPADADEESSALPMAVEVVIDLPGLGVIRRLMAVGL